MPNKKTLNPDDPRIFHARKSMMGALTWVVCAVLLLPCYLVTRIWAMALLMPLLVLLGVLFFFDGLRTTVTVEKNKIEIETGHGFRTDIQVVDINSIQSIVIDATGEGKREVLHSVTFITPEGEVRLPEVECLGEIVEYVKNKKPDVKMLREGEQKRKKK